MKLLGREFRPGWLPTAMTLPAVLIMIGLGIWQLDRLAWKGALLERIHARHDAPPVTLDKLSGKPEADEYRRVVLRGSFVHERELFMPARSQNGNVGSHVLSTFVLDNGMAVLVNRGWVPPERKDPARRAEGQIKGPVELIATVRLSQSPGWFTPDNEPARNNWFYVDVAAMRDALGIATEIDYWFAVDAPANPGGYPLGGQTRVNIANDHLQYAATWFIFAITLVVIYLIFGLRRGRSEAA